MRETKFISQNKEKWERYEYFLTQSNIDPEELNEMYIAISDDLSYARTFYPNRSVRVYLNQLAIKISDQLFKTQSSTWKRFKHFWKTELPLLVWESRWEFVLAFAFFLLAALIGALSTAIDPDFPRLILGNDYVEMTLKNIEKGDPMAVYKGGWAVTDALGITANNILVSLLTFLLGIFAGLGTVFMLLRNGIMVGAFQYFFITKGVFWQSFLAIWLHGTLEISAIVIAGAAGMTMGKGLLFPATFTRTQAFQRSARRGFKIMLGIIPVLMIAGTVEGFLTRYTQAPTILRLGFILISLAFILFYFIWLPYQTNKSNAENTLIDRPLAADDTNPIQWDKIRSASNVFSDAFLLLLSNAGTLLSWIFVSTIFYAIFNFIFTEGLVRDYFVFRKAINNEVLQVFMFLFNFPMRIIDYHTLLAVNHLPFLAVVHVLILSTIGAYSFILVRKEKLDIGNVLKKIAVLLLPVSILQILLWLDIPLVSFSVFLLLPLCFLMMWAALEQNTLNFFQSIGEGFRLMKTSYWMSLGSMLLLLISGATLFSLLEKVESIFWELIQLHLLIDVATMSQLEALFECSVGFFCLLVTFVLLLIGSGFLYHTLREIDTAEMLLEKIHEIKTQRQIRGLAREE